MRPTTFALTLIAPLLAAFAAAQARPPATQPEAVDLARIRDLAAQANLPSARRWGTPVVYRFDGQLDTKGWTADEVKIVRMDDRWDVRPQKRFRLGRKLPEHARNAPAFRVDWWLRAWPADEGPVRIGVYVADPNRPFGLANVMFDFAMNRDGELQQILTQGQDHVRKAKAYAWGPLTHVSLEVAGRDVRGRRDKDDGITARSFRDLGLGADVHFGVAGIVDRMQLMACSVRPMVLAPAKELNDDEADAAAQLLDLLSRQVIPRLADPSYDARQEATDLLRKLGPAARPAIERALRNRSSLGPEAITRLQALAGEPGDDTIDLMAIPDPKLTETPAPIPATQPED